MVRHREGGTGSRVQQFPAQGFANLEQPGRSQHPVDMHHARGLLNTVLGDNQYPSTASAHCLDQRAGDGVYRADVRPSGRVLRPQALKVIVQVRQVDQAQARPMAGEDLKRAVRDPTRGADVRLGAPEMEEREWPQACGQLGLKARGLRIERRDLAPVGWIDRAWGHRPVCAGVHVVPPEELGAGGFGVMPRKRLPNLLASHQCVVLSPK
jgi:hypothetical protein